MVWEMYRPSKSVKLNKSSLGPNVGANIFERLISHDADCKHDAHVNDADADGHSNDDVNNETG